MSPIDIFFMLLLLFRDLEGGIRGGHSLLLFK